MLRLLTDRDLFEQRVLMPICSAGAMLVPLLIYLRVL